MNSNDTVIDDGGLADRLSTCLLTDNEFRSELESLLKKPGFCDHGLKLTISNLNGQLITTYQAQDVERGKPNQTRDLGDSSFAVKCGCEAWKRDAAGYHGPTLDSVIAHLTKLLALQWGGRDTKTTLPNLQTAGIAPRFVNAAKASYKKLAILHTDLDKFKAVNDQLGEKGGDTVLTVFAQRFRDHFSDFGIVVRTGGEEFSAILRSDSISDIISRVESFRAIMERETFEALGRPNTCSIGLALYETADQFALATNIDAILAEARSAEIRAKDEGRNRIMLLGPVPDLNSAVVSTEVDVRMAALRARSNITNIDRGDVLGAICSCLVEEIRGATLTDLTAKIKTFRDRFGILIGVSATEFERAPELLGILTPLEWATVVAKSFLATSYRGEGPIHPNNTISLHVATDGALALQFTDNSKTEALDLHCKVSAQASPVTSVIGRPFYPEASTPHGGISKALPAVLDDGTDSLSPVLLLPIGDTATSVAEPLRSLVAAIVDVDDRPVKGGGLPDFWQSNLSRVIRACLSNPNITVVLAIGDSSSAENTLKRLGNIVSDDMFELHRRLRIPVDALVSFKDRGIIVQNVGADVLDTLKSVESAIHYSESIEISGRAILDPNLEASRRRLRMAPPNDGNRLKITDGFRTKSLADAYPEAVQLIRAANDENTHIEISKRHFRELSCFKIVLTTPLNEMAPDYWRQDTTLLEDYYKDNFLLDTGVFGTRLNGSFNAAKSINDFAVDATVNALSNGQPTRRINLPIVPEFLEHPLGLSCIQILPRSENGKWLLDIIWVWRTVDALVGFPFSAYGSIRWTKDFLARVQGVLSATSKDISINIGELTYVALSFHMYLHDGDQEIARAIVQDASD